MLNLSSAASSGTEQGSSEAVAAHPESEFGWGSVEKAFVLT
jgi:hypothetical protein